MSILAALPAATALHDARRSELEACLGAVSTDELTSARGRGLSSPAEGVPSAAESAGGRRGALLLCLRARRLRVCGVDKAQAAVPDARGSTGRWAASEDGLTSARGRGWTIAAEGVLGAAGPAGGRCGACLLRLRARRRRAFGADETGTPERRLSATTHAFPVVGAARKLCETVGEGEKSVREVAGTSGGVDEAGRPPPEAAALEGRT